MSAHITTESKLQRKARFQVGKVNDLRHRLYQMLVAILQAASAVNDEMVEMFCYSARKPVGIATSNWPVSRYR